MNLQLIQVLCRQLKIFVINHGYKWANQTGQYSYVGRVKQNQYLWGNIVSFINMDTTVSDLCKALNLSQTLSIKHLRLINLLMYTPILVKGLCCTKYIQEGSYDCTLLI